MLSALRCELGGLRRSPLRMLRPRPPQLALSCVNALLQEDKQREPVLYDIKLQTQHHSRLR